MNKYNYILVALLLLLVFSGWWVYTNQPAPAAPLPILTTEVPIPIEDDLQDGPPPEQTLNMVSIENFRFNPETITIKKGTTVLWTNNDSVTHKIVGTRGGPSSPEIKPGESYLATFDTATTFSYQCGIHPSMRGNIVITD